MKKILIVCFVVMFSGLYAQNEVDALRYSEIDNIGVTARSAAMGGAFGALGSDFSTLSTNPAGLGVYLRSELSFTPSLSNRMTESTFYGNTLKDNKYKFQLGNLGLVFAAISNTSSDWKGLNLGLGINKLNNYTYNSIFEGNNPESSLLDYYVNYANEYGIEGDKLESKLANQAWLIQHDDSLNYWYNYAPYHDGILPVVQRESSKRVGSAEEFVISAATNYKDKLYIGATIGLPYLSFSRTILYREINENDPNLNPEAFKNFAKTDELDVTANGVNFKFGLIYRPLDWLRIGAAVHTPTFYSFEEDFSSNIKSDFLNGDYRDVSASGFYEYKLTTPMRLNASAALLNEKLGLLSFEYEFVDYSTAKFSTDDYEFLTENQVITEKYTAAHNFKLGAEYKINSFAFRAGYAFYGDPNDVSEKHNKTYYTFGLGMRENHFFADVAYTILNPFTESFRIYPESERVKIEPTSIDYKASNILLTLGYRF